VCVQIFPAFSGLLFVPRNHSHSYPFTWFSFSKEISLVTRKTVHQRYINDERLTCRCVGTSEHVRCRSYRDDVLESQSCRRRSNDLTVSWRISPEAQAPINFPSLKTPSNGAAMKCAPLISRSPLRQLFVQAINWKLPTVFPQPVTETRRVCRGLSPSICMFWQEKRPTPTRKLTLPARSIFSF